MPGPLRNFFGYHVVVDRIDCSTEKVAMRVRVTRTRIFDGVTKCTHSYPVRGYEGRWEHLTDSGRWRRLPRWIEVEINAHWKRRADAAIHAEEGQRKRAWLNTAPQMTAKYW